MTVDTAFARYFEEKSIRAASENETFAALDRIAAMLGEDTLLSELDDDTIACFVAARRGMKARRKPGFVANATVNRDTELLRRVLRRARKVWRADTGADTPDWPQHLLPEADGRVRELSAAEEAALFDALRADFHPLFEFALLSGMRFMNIARLTWRQIDFDTRSIAYRVKSRHPGGRAVSLPLTAAMRDLLANQRGKHPIYAFTYVCQRGRGQRRKGQRYPFSRNGWRQTWKEALAEAGIEDFRFHDLRHTAGTRTLRASGNIRATQLQLGHRTIASTLRYAHATQDDVRQAMEAAHSRNSPEPLATDSTKRLKEIT